jgi:hypothetical protein
MQISYTNSINFALSDIISVMTDLIVTHIIATASTAYICNSHITVTARHYRHHLHHLHSYHNHNHPASF